MGDGMVLNDSEAGSEFGGGDRLSLVSGNVLDSIGSERYLLQPGTSIGSHSWTRVRGGLSLLDHFCWPNFRGSLERFLAGGIDEDALRRRLDMLIAHIEEQISQAEEIRDGLGVTGVP